jgi:hypothetical protein
MVPAQLRDIYLGGLVAPPPPSRFVAIAGQPGSGKRRLAIDAQTQMTLCGAYAVHLDSDALRDHVPGYAVLARSDPDAAFRLSQPYVSAWADEIRDAAIRCNYNLVLEGLFKTPSTREALWGVLQAQNYHRALQMRLVPRFLSLIQIEYRYEKQLAAQLRSASEDQPSGRREIKSVGEASPRRVPASNHNDAVKGLPAQLASAVAAPFDEILIVDSQGHRAIEARGSAVNGALVDRFQMLLEAPVSTSVVDAATGRYVETLRMRMARGAPIDPDPGSALEFAAQALAELDAI